MRSNCDNRRGGIRKKNLRLRVAEAVCVASFLLVLILIMGEFYVSQKLDILIHAIALIYVYAIIMIIESEYYIKASAIEAADVSKSSSGYIVPLLGALILIALSVTVLLPNFLRARASGQLVACSSNLKNIGTALEMYSTDARGRYPRQLEDLTPNYLRVIPTCAAAGRITYSYTYTEVPDAYTVWCAGSYHKNIFLPNFPQYDSIQGLITN